MNLREPLLEDSAGHYKAKTSAKPEVNSFGRTESTISTSIELSMSENAELGMSRTYTSGELDDDGFRMHNRNDSRSAFLAGRSDTEE
jgi:hypothetical protein